MFEGGVAMSDSHGTWVLIDDNAVRLVHNMASGHEGVDVTGWHVAAVIEQHNRWGPPLPIPLCARAWVTRPGGLVQIRPGEPRHAASGRVMGWPGPDLPMQEVLHMLPNP